LEEGNSARNQHPAIPARHALPADPPHAGARPAARLCHRARIKDSSEEALAIEEGSLYPALNRMLPCGARLFPHPHCRAKLAPRPRQSFASRDAALLQFIGMRLYVELQFVIELMVEASPDARDVPIALPALSADSS